MIHIRNAVLKDALRESVDKIVSDVSGKNQPGSNRIFSIRNDASQKEGVISKEISKIYAT